MTIFEERSELNAVADSGRRVPGEAGVWVFIIGDMMSFSLLFLLFLYYRSFDIPAFTASQDLLNLNFGAINTILLLTSSWFVALGLGAARRAKPQASARLFLLALLCAVGFALVKYVEWGEKIRAGIVLTSNDFFMYYYLLTGIHFLHLIVGMGVLVFLIMKARAGHHAVSDVRIYESGGAYWHMVDLLWIVLFPLLYLVR